MTIYITNIPSASDNLSSGHIFWEIFTCYILSILIPNVIPVYNNTWEKSQIITSSMKKNSINDFNKLRTITYFKISLF